MIKNKQLNQPSNNLGDPLLRVWRRKAHGTQSPRLLIKCGYCDKQVEIYYSTDRLDDLIEINGVCATREQWEQIFREIGLIDNRVYEK